MSSFIGMLTSEGLCLATTIHKKVHSTATLQALSHCSFHFSLSFTRQNNSLVPLLLHCVGKALAFVYPI